MARPRYDLRPAKHVERRMMVEACRRLAAVAPLKKYEYVGFGALEFIDFDLIHRALGVPRMTSIEHDTNWPMRYEFNRPFKGINVLIGKASAHLPTLDWNGLRIVWLDYEQLLDKEVIRDCETVSRVLHQGSLLIVTVCAGCEFGRRLEMLTKKVGEEWIPGGLTEDQLNGTWAYADAQRRVLTEALAVVMASRHDGTRLRQIFNFNYADGGRMQTVGWVVSSASLDQTIDDGCRFDQFEFVREGDEAMEIRVPVLTRREIAHLNRLLPLAKGKSLSEPWLDQDSQDQYAELYRWYPILG